MSQASSYNYGKFALGPIDPSTGKRTLIPSTASTHKVPAYNLTQASNAHVSGLRSEYLVAAIAQEDEDDSSDDTDDQSEEDDAPQAEPEEGESEETDESDSDSSEEISADIARLEVEDGEGGDSDNSNSGSGDATNTDEENDEAVTSAEEDDDNDDDQPTMPPSILKTGPSTRRKSVVVIAPGVSAPDTDPGYYRAQAKADKQILKKQWFVSESEAKEQADALARVRIEERGGQHMKVLRLALEL